MANDSTLPLDRNATPVQVLGPGNYSAGFSCTAVSARTALPTGCVAGDILRIASSQDCYIKFGTVTVTATTSDILFLAGAEFLKVPAGATHIAAIRVGADGVVQVTKMV
jgi:hypothetical protein